MSEKPLLVLASNSPRRRQLLALSGWMFSVQPARVDEVIQSGESPGDYVLRLARTKALSCAEHAHEEHIVIAADTAVVDGKDILGKPMNMDEATQMLKRLRGRTHKVYTAIAASRGDPPNQVTDLCVTDVPMRDYRDEEIYAYVISGDPFDKAGGYAIQHPDFQPVNLLQGCYASVMGLPLCHLVRLLRSLEIAPVKDVPGNCQSAHNYHCPIFRAVLRGEQVG